MTSPTPAAEVPRRIAGYEIIDDLGLVGATRRFKAVQVALGRPVVLNVLPAEAARKPALAAMFDRHVNVASALRHENVVGAIDAGEFEGCRYVAMEFVEGPTLHDALPREGDLWEVKRCLAVTLDVAKALAHLETLGVVHRYVSPRSVLLAEAGPARLVDYRRAKFLEPGAGETWSEETPYAAAYTAPEFARGEQDIDIRSDLYSLGCVLYHLLTGRPPFLGRSAAILLDWHRTRRPRDPRRLRPDLPDDVVDLTGRCLRKQRTLRHPTAVALATDLEALLAGRPPKEPAPPGLVWS